MKSRQLTVYVGNSASLEQKPGTKVFHTTMPFKTLFGTFAAVYYFFLALLPEVSSNVYRRSLLLVRRFQRSHHVVVALVNTDPSRLRRIRRTKMSMVLSKEPILV